MRCDSHVHVFGPRHRYPQIAKRAYTAGVASVEILKNNAIPLGITRFVIVQASVNGADNSCLLDTLDALDGHGRGVVVVDPKAVTTSSLDGWARRGVRGLRVNLYSGGARAERGDLERRFRSIADLVPAGWHVEVIAPLRLLAAAAALLSRSPVPVVIDHYGLPGGDVTESEDGRALLELMHAPHVWMKLSGPYRAIEQNGSDPRSTVPPSAWLRAFLEAAPDRLVWGSDWPHTPPHEESVSGEQADPFRPIDYGRMLGDFVAAVNELRTLEAILVANPARLYGFA